MMKEIYARGPVASCAHRARAAKQLERAQLTAAWRRFERGRGADSCGHLLQAWRARMNSRPTPEVVSQPQPPDLPP